MNDTRPALASLTVTFFIALFIGAALTYFGMKEIIASERTRPNYFVVPSLGDTFAPTAKPAPKMNAGPFTNAGPSNSNETASSSSVPLPPDHVSLVKPAPVLQELPMPAASKMSEEPVASPKR